MKKIKVLFIVLLVLVLGVLMAIGCGQSEPSPTTTSSATAVATTESTQPVTSAASSGPQRGGVLKIIYSTPIETFDAPIDATGRPGTYLLHAIMDPLFYFDSNNNPIPCLATSMNIAEDGKSVTLSLRKGVKFQDGTEFNAEAVKFHIENFKPGAPSFSNITSMDIIDDNTIRLNLSAWDATLPLNFHMQCPIGSPTAALQSNPQDRIVGAGPFKLLEWKRDSYVKYERYDGYWDQGKPYLDGLEFISIVDPTVALMAFENGDGQALAFTSQKNGRDLLDKGYKIEYIDMSITYLAGDGSNPDSPFADQRVREALEYAIDKNKLTSSFGYGFSEPVGQMVPPRILIGYNPDIQGRQYDPSKAKQLLAEAGYPTGFKTTLIAKTTDDKEILTAIQNYLSAVGINVQFDIADSARFFQIGQDGWEGIIFSGCGVNITSIRPIKAFFDANGRFNHSIYRVPEFQETLYQAAGEWRTEQHKELMKKLVRMIYEGAMVAPLYTNSNVFVAQQSVNETNFCGPSAGFTPAEAWLSK